MSEENSEALKAKLRADWSARGAAWDRWADDMAALAERFNQPLIEAADIGPGQTVLDLASGAGEPALSLAREVGAGGRVVATDLVEEMLAGARRRAAAAGLDNIAFEIADMDHLPYEDASFDRVVCRFGIMFSPRPVAALAEARRVLRPGGRAAYLVWGPRDDTTMFKVLWAVIDEVLGAPDRAFVYPPFRLGEPGTVAALMREAGFEGVEEVERRFAAEIPAERPFWRPQVELAFAPLLEGLDEAARAGLETALARAFAAHREGDVYRLEAHVRLARGDAPA